MSCGSNIYLKAVRISCVPSSSRNTPFSFVVRDCFQRYCPCTSFPISSPRACCTHQERSHASCATADLSVTTSSAYSLCGLLHERRSFIHTLRNPKQPWHRVNGSDCPPIWNKDKQNTAFIGASAERFLICDPAPPRIALASDTTTISPADSH